MAFVYIFYILLFIGFIVMSALIFRYSKKFGHLAPRFKWVLTILGTLAAITIIFSMYFLTQLNKTPSGSNSSSTSTTNTNTNSNSSVGDLNF